MDGIEGNEMNGYVMNLQTNRLLNLPLQNGIFDRIFVRGSSRSTRQGKWVERTLLVEAALLLPRRRKMRVMRVRRRMWCHRIAATPRPPASASGRCLFQTGSCQRTAFSTRRSLPMHRREATYTGPLSSTQQSALPLLPRQKLVV